jgi:hypothetical protein
MTMGTRGIAVNKTLQSSAAIYRTAPIWDLRRNALNFVHFFSPYFLYFLFAKI